jgi:hypothetical protein
VIKAKVVIVILTTSPGQSSPAKVDRQESELYFSFLMAHDNEEAKVEYALALLFHKFGRFDIAAARCLLYEVAASNRFGN